MDTSELSSKVRQTPPPRGIAWYYTWLGFLLSLTTVPTSLIHPLRMSPHYNISFQRTSTEAVKEKKEGYQLIYTVMLFL